MKFNFHVILKISGVIAMIVALSMLPAAIISAVCGESEALRAFLLSMLPFFAAGCLIFVFTKPLSASLRMREGIFIVSWCWMLSSLLGSLPYMLCGAAPGFVDAFFESASAFTTTGATLMPDLEALPKGMFFWRALSNWLGGMGILIFAVSILPALGIGALNIAKAETPGPTLDKMTPRMSDSARLLYGIYIALTAAEFLLLVGRMGPFEAAVHSFASVGTGGLSTRSLGIAEFRDPFIEYVIAAFCLLSSINFINYRELLARRWRNFFRDPELRAFVGTIAACTAFIGASLWLSGGYASAHDSFKQAFLQVSALVSTSGYVTADFSLWPSACQWLILILIMVGGCSSSTAGGLKIIRVQIMLRLMLRNVYKRLHPRAVVAVKLGGKAVSAETASNVSAFLLTYFAIFVLGTFVLAAMDGKDMLTSLSAAAAALSNNSVGFGQIGHLGTFGVFSAPARVFLALLMIVGRLEIFTVLILFTPAYWRMGRG